MSIEEISLVFDYGTKDGRERALEELHQRGDDKTHHPDEQLGDEEQAGKLERAHVEIPDEQRR